MPTIGITSSAANAANVTLHNAYVNAILAAGGIPLVLPIKPGLEKDYISALDGILFSGGGDIQGRYFGQENHEKAEGFSESRDEFEIALAKFAYEEKKPVMGICRGAQVINVAMGGSLLQHVDGHLQKDSRATATHNADIIMGSRLNLWLKQGKVPVNSFHHQVVDVLADIFTVSANSCDGLIEAYEYPGTDWFCQCYQWHPEAMLESPEHVQMLELFKSFVDACAPVNI